MQSISRFIKSELSGWSNSEKIFVPLLIIIVLLASLAAKDSCVAILSAIFGLSYTIIAGKGKISCYFFGIIGTLCYAYLAFENALYGNLILYLGYYFPMEIVGIFFWKKNLKKENNEIKKTYLKLAERISLFVIAILATALFGLVLRHLGDKFPMIDAAATILSVIGMYLTVRRCIEQWIIWTVVNFLTVCMWFVIYESGAKTFATLLMWIIYLFLGIYFFFQWRKEINYQNKSSNQAN